MGNRSEAQRRADQVQAFRDELRQIEKDQVTRLSDAQQASIALYHNDLLLALSTTFDVDTNAGQKQLSRGMQIASFIGALALAASLFFLFYQFWGYLETPFQVSILIASPVLLLLLTAWISKREATGYFAKLSAMASFAAFVLNLVMLGNIFNITPSDSALLIWALFGGLLAYAFDLRLLLVVAIAALSGFAAAQLGSLAGFYWLGMVERPENFLVPAVLIFTTPLIINQDRYRGFAAVYRVFGICLFLVPILILSNLGQSSYLPFDDGLIELLYQFAGFGVSALLIWLGIRYNWAEVVNTGNGFFVLFLYARLFDWWWESMPKSLFFLLIALLSILMLSVYRRIRLATQTDGGDGA